MKKSHIKKPTSSHFERSRIVSVTPDEIEQTLRSQGFTPRGDY